MSWLEKKNVREPSLNLIFLLNLLVGKCVGSLLSYINNHKLIGTPPNTIFKCFCFSQPKLRNEFYLATLLGTRHDPGLGIIVCTASPCRSLHSLFYHNFPSTWCLDLCSHISLKNITCCVCISAPWCKTRQSTRSVRRLPDARSISTLDKVLRVPWWFQNWCIEIKLH
jgi:hypothetical protein